MRIWPGKRKRSELIQSFDVRFNDPLMAFKVKYGHCNVSCIGEDASLGRWCSVVRRSYKKIQKNEKPLMNLSDEQIQRFNDAGFKFCLRKRELQSIILFGKRFNDLMAFKAKFGHCNVSLHYGENVTLGKWCAAVRGAYKKMQNNQKTYIKLSDEQIQRLNDVGFKWCRYSKSFDEHFNELMAFKAKYGHCNVSQYGEDASLGKWCCRQRGSYKKMEHNRIQRLNDAGFNWIW